MIAAFAALVAILASAMSFTPGAAVADEPSARSASTARSATRHASASAAKSDKQTVRVWVYDADGKLVGPVNSPLLLLSAAEWKHRLTPEQYKVLRAKGTEQAFCGTLLENKLEGVYACAGCGLPLFISEAKFESGTGWPSFTRPVAKENIETHLDLSDGTPRMEVHCVRCKGHMGHVFDDGPAPTGLRYCLNSASLVFTPGDELAKLADAAAASLTNPRDSDAGRARPAERPRAKGSASLVAHHGEGNETAVFAGGCFWCTEAVFEQVKGVLDVESGYCGGTAATANYEHVHEGTTRHAEAIRITYDPTRIRYDQLLDVFFDTHDPTQLNRQGEDDIGRQYRSAIFFASDEQKKDAQAKIKQLEEKKVFKRKIVTRLEPLTTFYPAEAFHQDFASRFPFDSYIQQHAVPKVCELRLKHPELIEPSK